MNGTREREPSVRLSSEIALANMLNLKENDSLYKVFIFFSILTFILNLLKIYNIKECLSLMDVMKESFEDCVKSLSKECFVQNVAKDKCFIDETIIRI